MFIHAMSRRSSKRMKHHFRLNYRVQIRVFANSVIPEHKNKIKNEFLRFFFLFLHNGLCFI